MSTESPRSDVDLVVLDLDGGEHLDHCLASIARQRRPVARVVVWDNGSVVPVGERMRGRHYPFELALARSAENLGFTGGVNAALELCTAPFVGLVNNDVVLDAGWVEMLRPMFDGAERLAAVQGVITTLDGRIDGAGIDVSDGTLRQLLHGSPAESVTTAPDPWGVSATAALYRREALSDVATGRDVLRADLFAYYEDVELSARLRARGWSLALCRTLLATHAGSATAHRLGGRRLVLQTRNRYLVARAWPGAGSVGALLREDLVRIVRCVASFDLTGVTSIMKGVASGMLRASAS